MTWLTPSDCSTCIKGYLVLKIREKCLAMRSVQGMSTLSFPVPWFLFPFTDFLYFFHLTSPAEVSGKQRIQRKRALELKFEQILGSVTSGKITGTKAGFINLFDSVFEA